MFNFRYITPDGQPPLGGLPPNIHAAMRTQAREFPPPYTPHPYPTVFYAPRPIVGSIPGWLPWTSVATVLSIQNASATATTTSPPTTPPALPALSSTSVHSTSSQPPLPPGAYAPGSTSDTDTDTALVLPSGLGYIFPKSHTIIHIIKHDFLPFTFNNNQTNPHCPFKFRAFKIPTTLTVAELIEQICPVNINKNPHPPPEGNSKVIVAKGIVECIEVGDGKWVRGAEFWVGEGQGNGEEGRVGKTLEEIGWDGRRGTRMGPVWVATRVVYA
ncbi:hypothetical protein VTN00DRAFT_1614 [Thermoascus crustaceus]|uniref:uncharacterized protein n=1 Tax=Thermoascus crustaceus TaxID=5088 RepID=UPI003742072A